MKILNDEMKSLTALCQSLQISVNGVVIFAHLQILAHVPGYGTDPN